MRILDWDSAMAMTPVTRCDCGAAAHPLYGSKCEDCWAERAALLVGNGHHGVRVCKTQFHDGRVRRKGLGGS